MVKGLMPFLRIQAGDFVCFQTFCGCSSCGAGKPGLRRSESGALSTLQKEE